MKTNALIILWVIALIILLAGCTTTGKSLDDLAAGPNLDPKFLGNAEQLTKNEQQQLIDTLPPSLQPLSDEVGRLYIDGNSSRRVTVARSSREVPIEWGLPMHSGLYLRAGERPFSDCPVDGTPIEDGIPIVEAEDAFPHEPRDYYARDSGRVDWNILNPTYEIYHTYYFQGCLIDRFTGTFTGDSTNTIAVEIVGQLPDLVIHNAYIYNSGPRKGEMLLLVRDSESRSDLRGDTFDYTLLARHGRTEILSHTGTATFDPDYGGIIETGGGFRLPADGRLFQIEISINESRSISESDYTNNRSTISWQVNFPSILSFESIHVNENCDRRSPGEWRLDGRITVRSGVYFDQWAIGSREYLDTEDFTRYPSEPDNNLLALRVGNHPVDASLRLEIGFFDCNKLRCGEELREHPFGLARDSFTGHAVISFSPDDRNRGVIHEVSIDNDDCGFTGRFRLMNPDRARIEGYEIDAVLPPNPSE